MKSLYDILGICKDAEHNEIRTAYLAKARQYHPDKINIVRKGSTDVDFVQIKEAYDVLSNPHKRYIYDTSEDDDISIAEVSEMFDKFLSFVILASHILSYKWRRVDEDTHPLIPPHLKTTPSPPHPSSSSPPSLSSPRLSPPPIEIQVEASVRDVYYKKIKTISISVSNLDLQTRTEIFHIPIEVNRKRIEFRGRGDEYIIDEELTGRGSVIFNIEISDDPEVHLYNLFSNFDIMVEVNISLHDYIFGRSFSIFIFEEKVKVRYKGGSPKIIVLENMGLPITTMKIKGDEFASVDTPIDEWITHLGNHKSSHQACPPSHDIQRGKCFVILDLLIPDTFEHLNYKNKTDDLRMFKVLSRKFLS